MSEKISLDSSEMLKKLLGDLIIPNKYLPLHAEIEPKTQNCVERCKVVKTLFKGLTS